jgi:hypothetical protein
VRKLNVRKRLVVEIVRKALGNLRDFSGVVAVGFSQLVHIGWVHSHPAGRGPSGPSYYPAHGSQDGIMNRFSFLSLDEKRFWTSASNSLRSDDNEEKAVKIDDSNAYVYLPPGWNLDIGERTR